MAPRTEEQYEEIRQTKRRLIKETALELFAEKGFHSTSINDIAKKAGISKGLIYNYFKSKDELITEIIHWGMDEIMVLFDPDKDGFLTDDEFVYFINETFRIISENTKFWKLYFAILIQPDVLDVIKEKLLVLFPSLMKTMVDYFHRKGFEDPETEALFFHSAMDGIIMNYTANPQLFPLEKLKKKIIKMYNK